MKLDLKLLNYIFTVITIIIVLIFIIIALKKPKNLGTKPKESSFKLKMQKFFNSRQFKVGAIIIVIFLAVFTRFYKITTILNGLHVDEAGMAYDAFTLANYGVDRYLNSFPVYMINFGGGQSALYTYLAALIVKVVGLNVLAIRLPGILLSLLAIVFGFIAIRKSHGFKWGLLFAILMIICPWHVMQSRFGLDCNLLSSLLTIAISALYLSKKWWHYLITGILFGLTLYTYALAYLIVPIFLFLSLLYLLYIRKINFKNILILGIPLFLLALPLILMLLVNMGYLEQINVFNITIPKLFSYRGGEINFNNIFGNLLQAKNVFIADGLVYNSLHEVGTIYIFALPLTLLGLIITIKETYQSLKEKKLNLSVFFLFLFIANLILMALTPLNVNRANSIYIALLYFVFMAIKYLYYKFKTGFWIVIILYLVMALAFFNFYYYDYNNVYKDIPFVGKDTVEVLKYALDKKEDQDLYLHLDVHQPWIYILYANEESPYDFNASKKEEEVENYNNLYTYANYHLSLPDEVVEDAFYVIRPDETTKEFEKELEESDFTKEEYQGHLLFYK